MPARISRIAGAPPNFANGRVPHRQNGHAAERIGEALVAMLG